MTFTKMSLERYNFIPRSSIGHTISYKIDLKVFKYIRYQIDQQTDEIWLQVRNSINMQVWGGWNDF